jgi:hypothetical protein
MLGGYIENGQDGSEEVPMSPDTIHPSEHENWFSPVPPSYEQCVATPIRVQADCVVSPLAMAVLFWDEEDD